MDNLAGRIFFASIFLCLVAGCSIFKQPDEETATGGLNMRGYRMPTDSVVVELAIVDAPATQA